MRAEHYVTKFSIWSEMYKVDEHGQGRLGDGGEIFGNVLLTGVAVVSTGGNLAKNAGIVHR
jgi:hypothetical protein